MGWNSWNFFRCEINETLIKQVADAIVDSGLKDAGYTYVNLDDCWQEKRADDGTVVPFASKFPGGMKNLADYIHSKGLKFGLYSDTGRKTCEGYPGSYTFEKQDAETYASWGVDYLKYDFCNMEGITEAADVTYARMRDALNATGRPVLFSICNWGAQEPWKWGSKTGNSWRTGIDVFAVWDADQAKALKLPNFLQPVLGAVRQNQRLYKYAGPGGFNDPDMLVVGLDGMYPYGIVQDCPTHVVGCTPGSYISRERWGSVGGLTATEQRTHFSLWCMMASPLILGNDPRHMTQATINILTAREVIAVNQDPLGYQGYKVYGEAGVEVWVKPLSDGTAAVLLFNTNASPRDITVDFKRDMAEVVKPWLRDIKVAPPACQDKHAGCKDWAASGECEKNPGFMLNGCPGSCPKGCQAPPQPSGMQATAVVRDLWQEDDLGVFLGSFTAHLVEAHEGRLLKMTFVEPGTQLTRKWRATPIKILSSAVAAVNASSGEGSADVEAGVATQALSTLTSNMVTNLKTKVDALTAELDNKRRMLEAAEKEARRRVTALEAELLSLRAGEIGGGSAKSRGGGSVRAFMSARVPGAQGSWPLWAVLLISNSVVAALTLAGGYMYMQRSTRRLRHGALLLQGLPHVTTHTHGHSSLHMKDG